ncbi:MAG: hypothetical protein GW892_08730 [Armatimonadetes bacterium]|nr:hypothetical protein [Armatimonadota bacterium]NCO89750.1 hypothetical protein [Armatimonadota bacterium]NCP34791.1 hypothetical protein [Armatimonadota bacterium]
MKEKYLIRDLHPLIFFYGLAFGLLMASVPLPLGIRVFWKWGTVGHIPSISALACSSP